MFTGSLKRIARHFNSLLFVIGLSCGTPTAHATDGQLEHGATLYKYGVSAEDEALPACENCHRRSGLGSSEGRVLIPAINGTALNQPLGALDYRLYQQRQTRPAYDDASFAATLRSGLDPSGRKLHPLMPRYALDDADASALYAYLQTLSREYSPGVDAEYMHLATILVDGADPLRSAAMLEIFRRFTEARNRETRHEPKRAANAPYQREFRYQSHRRWQLHEWRLSGPPHSWPEQLTSQYAAQPVFAVIGGIGGDDWQPVHTFCNAHRLACLFPQLNTPPESEAFYTLYLSRGVLVEAEVLAESLQQQSTPARLTQVDDGSASALAAAARFSRAAAALGLTLDGSHSLDCPADVEGQLLVWGDRALLDRCAAASPQAALIASTTLSELDGPAPDYAARLQLISRRALAGDRRNATRRVRSWMKSSGIPSRHLDTELDSYYAITTFADAQRHILQRFHNEYLIERIEHMIDNSLLQPAAAQVSLAQGQRVISKGAYFGSYRDWAAGSAAMRWITPSGLDQHPLEGQ